MLTIYGVYRSRASRNLWTLEETGLPYRLEPVIQAYRLADPAAPDAPMNTQSPEFLRLSPAGAIPLMEDEGLILSESQAINMYIAWKAESPLGPQSVGEEMQMVQWALYGAASIEPFALDLSFVHRRGQAQTPEGQREITRALSELARPLAALEAHLAVHSHMVGGRFTVADINMAEILRYAQDQPGLLEEVPRVLSWLTLCQARPGFKAMWAAREAEPA